jgi:hypothetical protein
LRAFRESEKIFPENATRAPRILLLLLKDERKTSFPKISPGGQNNTFISAGLSKENSVRAQDGKNNGGKTMSEEMNKNVRSLGDEELDAVSAV